MHQFLNDVGKGNVVVLPFSQLLGWCFVPIISAQLDVILRSTIPMELQGRVYTCRNSFQFFTIPLGLFFGGVMVDNVCTPLMTNIPPDSFLATLFGSGAGRGPALVMFLLGLLGGVICLVFWRILSRYQLHE